MADANGNAVEVPLGGLTRGWLFGLFAYQIR